MSAPNPAKPRLVEMPIHPSQQTFGAGSWSRRYAQAFAPGGESNVPCGDCSECCTFGAEGFAHVELTDGEGDASTYRTHEVDGKLVLDTREDGSCVYLEDGRCSIYSRRPWACRVFDCRIFPFVGAVNGTRYADAAVRKFRFVSKAPGDAELLFAAKLAFTQLHAMTGDVEVSASAASFPRTLEAVMSHPKFESTFAAARQMARDLDAAEAAEGAA